MKRPRRSWPRSPTHSNISACVSKGSRTPTAGMGICLRDTMRKPSHLHKGSVAQRCPRQRAAADSTSFSTGSGIRLERGDEPLDLAARGVMDERRAQYALVGVEAERLHQAIRAEVRSADAELVLRQTPRNVA